MIIYPKPYKRSVSKYYYFHYYDNQNKRYEKSTRQTTKYKAVLFIKDFMDKLYDSLKPPSHKKGEVAFREYAEPYFIWNICPRVQRRINEGKSIGKTHVKKSRQWLEKYVFPDEFAKLQMNLIRRADILELRKRIQKIAGPNTCNKVIDSVKTIFSEAYFREEIDKNPGSRIGHIKYKKKEQGIFTQKEIHYLFVNKHLWKDNISYTCFLLAATTGMRKSEILALKWGAINWEIGSIKVEEAWKTTHETGMPKWNRIRIIPLPKTTLKKLQEYMDEKLPNIHPDDLVFCWEKSVRFGEKIIEKGHRLGDTWWEKRFIYAMEQAGIDYKKRKLRPHSFRHTLNTLLRNAGYDPAKIRATLGWQQESTQDNYTHFHLEHLKDQAKLIEKIIE